MKRVAIIGGGLAGTACAYVLKQAGAEPVIYEAGATLAGGASGNPSGLCNPRLSAHRTPESDFYSAAFSLAVRTFDGLDDVDWNPCGALHLMTDEKQKKRFEQTARNWGWPPGDMLLLDADGASEVAGIEIKYEALYLPQSGTISPKKLCARYAQGVEVHLNTTIQSLADIKADAVILACGMGIKAFEETRGVPLAPVRGQITFTKATQASRNLRCNLCYGGAFSAAQDGVHMVGSTFQRECEGADIREEDDVENIEGLRAVVPDLAEGLEVVDSRAAVRVSSKDYFPVVGQAHDCKDLYVSAAHGSYGIVSSIAAAHLLADMILGRPLSLGKDVTGKLNPARFL